MCMSATAKNKATGKALAAPSKVRKTPCRPRSWANFSLW
jgi:hypothetical protein